MALPCSGFANYNSDTLHHPDHEKYVQTCEKPKYMNILRVENH